MIIFSSRGLTYRLEIKHFNHKTTAPDAAERMIFIPHIKTNKAVDLIDDRTYEHAYCPPISKEFSSKLHFIPAIPVIVSDTS